MENVAVVSTADALANWTLPGPETAVHVVVTEPGDVGSPSSVTVPSSEAAAPSTMERSGPASTLGGWFTGAASTEIVSSSNAWREPSLAVSRRT